MLINVQQDDIVFTLILSTSQNYTPKLTNYNQCNDDNHRKLPKKQGLYNRNIIIEYQLPRDFDNTAK